MKTRKYMVATLAVLVMALIFSACNPIGGERFDTSLLPGYWQRSSTLTDGLDCYRFDQAGTGATWDTGDDVSESEAQPFTWSVSGSDLTIIHIGEMGARIPKTYKLKELTSTRLNFVDSYSVSYTFTRYQP